MVAVPRRTARLVCYLLFAASGVAALAWPAPSVRAASGTYVYVWAAFTLVGGGACAAGSITDRWFGEYVGLPLLAATFAVFGVSAFATGRVSAIAGGCAMLAIGGFILARWQDVATVRREAARQAGRDPGT